MTRPRRGPWFEVELRDDPDDVRVLFAPGWTNDTEGLFLPLRETGWFATTVETRLALAGVTLTWGWIGVDDDLNLVECSVDGSVPNTGEFVEEVGQVTLARFRASG